MPEWVFWTVLAEPCFHLVPWRHDHHALISHREHSSGNVVKKKSTKQKSVTYCVSSERLASQQRTRQSQHRHKVMEEKPQWETFYLRSPRLALYPRATPAWWCQGMYISSSGQFNLKGRKSTCNLNVQKQKEINHGTCIKWPLSHHYINGLQWQEQLSITQHYMKKASFKAIYAVWIHFSLKDKVIIFQETELYRNSAYTQKKSGRIYIYINSKLFTSEQLRFMDRVEKKNWEKKENLYFNLLLIFFLYFKKSESYQKFPRTSCEKLINVNIST